MCIVTTAVLSEQTLAAIAAGLTALRAAHVEPMGLGVNPGSDSRLAWSWYKFKALPGHPRPGNAGRGYSHPTAIAAFEASAHRRLAPPVLSADDVAGMTDGELLEGVALPLLDACGLDRRCWSMTVARHDDGEVAAIDLTRGGVDPWAEYPDAGLDPVVEQVPDGEGGSFAALHYGGEPEKRRVRRVRRNERATTNAYMARRLPELPVA